MKLFWLFKDWFLFLLFYLTPLVYCFSLLRAEESSFDADFWTSRIVDFSVVDSNGSSQWIRGIILSADGKVLTLSNVFYGKTVKETKRWDFRPVQYLGWILREPEKDLLLVQVEGKSFSALRIVSKDSWPQGAGLEFFIPLPTPEEPRKIGKYKLKELPETDSQHLYFSGETAGVLLGSPVINEKDQTIGIVDGIDPQKELVRARLLSAPLEILDKADRLMEYAFWKENLDAIKQKGEQDPRLASSPYWINLWQSVQRSDIEKNADLLIQVFPKSDVAWASAAANYLRISLLDKADFAIRKATSLNETDYHYPILFAQIMISRKEWNPAIDALLKAREDGALSKEIAYPLGICLNQIGQFERAVEELKSYVESRPRHVSAWLLMGEIFQKMQNWDKSVGAFMKAARLNPQSIRAWVGIAESYLALAKWEQASEAYTELSLLEPKNPSIWYNLGLVLLKMEQEKFARACFLRVVQLNPKDRDGWFNFGVLSQKVGERLVALDAYKKTIQIDPRFGMGWFNLGCLCQELHLFPEAIDAWHRAEENLPGDIRPLINLVFLENQLHDFNERDKDLTKIENLNPQLAHQIKYKIANSAH
ncbi:tetratricopeptide repeat protein [Methylacidiphilum caldifontis]|uniref:tetratricopeptide repeat protein n=1 Tax=Methylacidiphilum caldifontis TaxID=2795386 RepID=UPI001A8C4B37|nr:tetratricopeptide repeat protein [Methylacidiphilum caldifontis]QSR89131.1 tetratricopeptide repeat protein [Methylacidiphilum caldifontis]